MADFSTRLSELIAFDGCQKKDIAEFIGVTYRQFHRYETGEQKPDFDGLLKLAEYFGVSLDYLVGLSDDPRRVEDLIPDEHAAGSE
ncbi:helix-turn-helix domain-containing protein [Alicyclobacillus sp. SP_1]|uniref:helix-turn-helix domain-containing protein n=1 Tax=Alicyclobacillus sp. SP_1 TaxID=2942475 RepID=UPI0021584024|nr:helix-turn-helix transcriptional regulator [Alicyclobacillus sp. SP_1]